MYLVKIHWASSIRNFIPINIMLIYIPIWLCLINILFFAPTEVAPLLLTILALHVSASIIFFHATYATIRTGHLRTKFYALIKSFLEIFKFITLKMRKKFSLYFLIFFILCMIILWWNENFFLANYAATYFTSRFLAIEKLHFMILSRKHVVVAIGAAFNNFIWSTFFQGNLKNILVKLLRSENSFNRVLENITLA